MERRRAAEVNVLIAFCVNRIQVGDCQEAYVDLKRDLLVDGRGLPGKVKMNVIPSATEEN